MFLTYFYSLPLLKLSQSISTIYIAIVLYRKGVIFNDRNYSIRILICKNFTKLQKICLPTLTRLHASWTIQWYTFGPLNVMSVLMAGIGCSNILSFLISSSQMLFIYMLDLLRTCADFWVIIYSIILISCMISSISDFLAVTRLILEMNSVKKVICGSVEDVTKRQIEN